MLNDGLGLSILIIDFRQQSFKLLNQFVFKVIFAEIMAGVALIVSPPNIFAFNVGTFRATAQPHFDLIAIGCDSDKITLGDHPYRQPRTGPLCFALTPELAFAGNKIHPDAWVIFFKFGFYTFK